MKCVQLSDGKIIRVSDIEAYKIVEEEKKGQYIAKKYWKEKRKENKSE